MAEDEGKEDEIVWTTSLLSTREPSTMQAFAAAAP